MVTYNIAPFVQLFNRTLQKHQIKMKSYVAIQKKLLVILYAMWKKNEGFNSQFAKEEAVSPLGQAS